MKGCEAGNHDCACCPNNWAYISDVISPSSNEEIIVIDYRELLKKYINLIGECEGIDYIDECSKKKFTRQEVEELKKCAAETNIRDWGII